MTHLFKQIVALSFIIVLSGFGLSACDTDNTDESQGDTESEASTDANNESLVRMVYIFRRLPELSLKEFRDHWRDVHAPLVLKHKETLGIHGYSQLHNAQPSANRLMQNLRGTIRCFDGVGEFTIERDKLEKARETVEGRKAMDELIEDERLFVDFSKSSIWLAKEHVIVRDRSYVPPVPASKLTWVGSGLESLTFEEFQDYYLNEHAPLVAGHAELLGIRDYVQSHTLNDSLGEELRQLRGEMAAPYGIHAEFFWNLAGVVSPKGNKAMTEIQNDEKNFIDFSRSAIWTAEEHIFAAPNDYD